MVDFSRVVDVLSCDDVIIYKLIARRIIDLADAANLLRLNRATLDLGYLGRWVARHKLSTKFEPVWQEEFPGETAPKWQFGSVDTS